MTLFSTYSVKIKEYNHIFEQTVSLYRNAVDFYINLIKTEWSLFEPLTSNLDAKSLAEALSVKTRFTPSPKYDFSADFYKFPSYLRRAAIAEAYGKVKSYKSNHKNWENTDKKIRKREPQLGKAGFVYPAMYKGNMFVREGTYTAKIKIYIRNTWDWLEIQLKKSDVDYILKHCANKKECAPTLQKRGKEWFLDFAFKETITLEDKSVYDSIIMGVDLGINNACTCSIMRCDGTVIGRYFLKLTREYDCLMHKISHIKRAQRKGSFQNKKWWAYAKGVNDRIAVKTAQFIIDIALKNNVNVIVFEHLDFKGKKRGNKQRLHLWRAKYVQGMVEHKAHQNNMHISRICARNTSRLAYDGSGKVKRGNESEKVNNNYSLCEFTNGKIYNCDLNASYNIAARYFVREILKTLPVTIGHHIMAKVPECEKRSTCTLSTLINLFSGTRTLGMVAGDEIVSGDSESKYAVIRHT